MRLIDADAINCKDVIGGERQKGKWIETEPLEYVCSNCGKEITTALIDENKYCRNCGSEMREVVEKINDRIIAEIVFQK